MSKSIKISFTLLVLFATFNAFTQPSFTIAVSFKLYEGKKIISKNQLDKKYQIIDNTWKNSHSINYKYNEKNKTFSLNGEVVYNDLKIQLIRHKDTMQLVFETNGGVDQIFTIENLTFKEGVFLIKDKNTKSLDLKNSSSNYYNSLLAAVNENNLQQQNNLLLKEINKLKLKYGIDDDDFNPKNKEELIEISSLKDDQILKRYSDYLSNKNFMNDSENDRMKEGKITYSPDKLFKIFVFEGESCGANCHRFYNSFIHFNLDKKNPTVLDSNFFPIDSIVKMDDKNYLVFHSGFNGGGIYTYSNKAITIVRLEKNKLVFGKSSVSTINKSNKSESEVNISVRANDTDENDDCYLKFNPQTNAVEYRYWEINEDTGVKKTFSGKLVYTDGVFRWISKSG